MVKGPHTPRRPRGCPIQAAVLFGNLALWGGIIAAGIWVVL